MFALRHSLFCLLCGHVAVAGTALADGRQALYGHWGDARHCGRALVQPGGTVRAEPFEIGVGWLRHGELWCRLTWFPVQARSDGLFAPARALCGEDGGRSYRLDFALRGETLHLIWDEALVNGPLRRCGAGR